MTPGLRRLLLAIYIFVAAAAFLYLGFPTEALRTVIGHRLGASLAGLSVAVGAVRPSLSAGLVLKDVRISQTQKLLAVFDRVHIQPDLLSWLQPRTGYSFRGSLGNGEISGRAELDATAPTAKVSMSARFNGIMIQQVDGLRELRRVRDNRAVTRTLNDLEQGVRSGRNVMPFLVDCCRAYATVGEMTGVLRQVFGEWEEPSIF